MAPRKPIKTIPKAEPRPEPKPERKRSTENTNKSGFWKTTKHILTDERTHFVIGIALLISTIIYWCRLFPIFLAVLPISVNSIRQLQY